MTYVSKVAKTGLEPKDNQQTPPNAKPDGYTSPWRGAAIGGTLGGLLTTALGYLYGHRGRWLAYDAITGGAIGAGGGYAVYSHNNEKADKENKIFKTMNPHSKAYQEMVNKTEDEQFLKNRPDKRREWKQFQSEGGAEKWTNPIKAYKNWRYKNSLKADQAHIEDDAEALKRWRKNRFHEATFNVTDVLNPLDPPGPIHWLLNYITGYKTSRL